MTDLNDQEREAMEKKVAKIVRPFLFAQGTAAKDAASECARKVVAALAARKLADRTDEARGLTEERMIGPDGDEVRLVSDWQVVKDD